MKKYSSVCLGAVAAALLLAGEIQARTEKADKNRFVCAAESYINIRRNPSEEGEVVGKLYPSGIGTVLKTEEDGEWIRIRSGRVTGYVSSDLIVTGEEAEALMEQAGYTQAQVLPGGVQIYHDADDTTEVVDAPGESAFLTVLEEGEDWIRVRTPNGIEGWARKDAVSLTTVYDTAETLKVEQERLESIEEADASAAAESELWEIAQEALAASQETKIALMDVQMKVEEAQNALQESSGEASVESLKSAIEEEAAAQAAADLDQLDAETKVAEAQKASVTAQAAEKVAVEAARRAPRGAEGADFVTSRDHSIFIETSVGQELVNYACQFVGNPYVWGGESLTDGCDCSGFTMLVYARYGITLPHFAQSQAMYGELVSEEELEPGDLVFFQNATGYIHHVAIYIGNHSIVHAANSVSGICFSNIHYSSDRIICRHLLTS